MTRCPTLPADRWVALGLRCGGFLLTLLVAASCAELRPPSPEDGPRLPTPVNAATPQSLTPIATPIAEPLAPPGVDAPTVHGGTGVVVRSVQPAASTTQAVPAEGDVTLNFVDADVREVLRSVLGDVLHLNYVVDPKVQATITVQTSRPLRREDVLPLLQQVMRASGLVLVEASGIYRVVPVEEASRNGSAAVSVGQVGAAVRGDGATYNVQVVPLRFASASELLRTVEPFLPKGTVLEADTARNVLILSGTGQDLTTVLDLMRTFDVDWLSGMSYAIVPLQTGSAKAIVEEANGIFGPGGSVPLPGVLRLAPLERMNAVLVVSPQRAYLDQARGWIERLDQGDADNTPRVFQYRIENSRAADLAKVLNALISGNQGRAGGAEQPTTAPGTTPVSLGSPFGGASSSGSPPSNGVGTPASSLSSSSAPGAAPSLGSAPSTSNSSSTGATPFGASNGAQSTAPRDDTATGGPGGGDVGGGGQNNNNGPEFPQARIVADERNNNLLIYARPQVYRMIEAALKKIDVPPLQVLIEATIAEVTLTNDLQFGLQWLFKPGKNTISFSNVTAGTQAAVFPGFNAILGTTRANVVLNALKSITDVKVISSPQVLVLDRGVATLQVGDQVPILTAQVQSTVTTGAPVVNTVDYRDTGVILRVAPRVNSNGGVTLDVAQEVSDVTTTTSSTIDAPTFNRRRIESTVMVQDGETIALGGLIKDNHTFNRNGLPLLSDIPLLGALFRSDDNNKTRTELLILLSPKVVRNQQDARNVTDELRQRLQGLRQFDPAIR